MVDWAFAALPALLVGILAHGWKGQSGVIWAVITLMLYFILWSGWHLAVTLDVGLPAGLGGDTPIAAASAVLAACLTTFGLWSLRSSKSR
jgi:hypothetical protein